jgi:hypothetical protein
MLDPMPARTVVDSSLTESAEKDRQSAHAN